MNTFEPAINLVVLLSVLSVAAERLANLVKPRHADLPESRGRASRAGEKERERRIGNRVLVVSVLLAVAVKADFFAIVSHLDAPWDTLGWTRKVPIGSPAELLTTIVGTILTGLSLGFGSKFWHDVLDIVYGARDNLRRHTRRAGQPVDDA
jgi:type IV secretory pathway VirB2 component (pilin)